MENIRVTQRTAGYIQPLAQIIISSGKEGHIFRTDPYATDKSVLYEIHLTRYNIRLPLKPGHLENFIYCFQEKRIF